MIPVSFTKMHGCGNDYIYIDQMTSVLPVAPDALARQLSPRRFSVGADGVILVCPPENPENDARMRMFNADGSEGSMCGNGVRCVGKFLHDKGYLRTRRSDDVRIETKAGLRRLRLDITNGICTGATVDMGTADLTPSSVPVRWQGTRMCREEIEAAGRTWRVTAVSMGNPHAVIFCDDVAALPLAEIGPRFAESPLFPAGVNTEFVHVTDSTHLTMRVWERGSGETLACGTGACACAAAAIACGYSRADVPIAVQLPGGTLEVTVSAAWSVSLRGPAETVYEGIYAFPAP